MSELPDHVARNRGQWDRWAADYVAADEASHPTASLEWSRSWPCEEVWSASRS